MNRRQKLYLNTIVALLNQVAVLVCGFILPRYILGYFGSDINGLVTSITRFLSVISFMELGVGPVIQSNLYKPLAEKDTYAISRIIVSAERFYKKIAYFFLVYIGILFFVFPLVNREFSFGYSASLLLIISISTFSQYYFGITYQVFLNADQRVYIQSGLSMISVILNTIVCVALMKLGFGVHVMKLASSAVFVIRPLAQNIYVHKHYQIDHKITYTEEPIKQKWNGFAQHLASVVCGQIDVILLTLFSTYQNVSIYSVYFLVVNGISTLVMTAVSGLESFWGNMIAKEEKELLYKTFEGMECLIHAGVTALFTTTVVLIVPFVEVYTNGIADSPAYQLPLFGAMLTIGYACEALRVPYFRIIKAAGHYKQTQNGAFISMTLNILISVALVFKYQLDGVAIGTVVALLYHTVYFAWYLRKNIISRPFYYFVVHMVIDLVVGGVSLLATRTISLETVSYVSWVWMAIKVFLIVAGITAVCNVPIYHKEFKYVGKKILRKI